MKESRCELYENPPVYQCLRLQTTEGRYSASILPTYVHFATSYVIGTYPINSLLIFFLNDLKYTICLVCSGNLLYATDVAYKPCCLELCVLQRGVETLFVSELSLEGLLAVPGGILNVAKFLCIKVSLSIL